MNCGVGGERGRLREEREERDDGTGGTAGRAGGPMGRVERWSWCRAGRWLWCRAERGSCRTGETLRAIGYRGASGGVAAAGAIRWSLADTCNVSTG
jgi:hypothetical protein